jgi:hypothetical protein
VRRIDQLTYQTVDTGPGAVYFLAVFLPPAAFLDVFCRGRNVRDGVRFATRRRNQVQKRAQTAGPTLALLFLGLAAFAALAGLAGAGAGAGAGAAAAAFAGDAFDLAILTAVRRKSV